MKHFIAILTILLIAFIWLVGVYLQQYGANWGMIFLPISLLTLFEGILLHEFYRY